MRINEENKELINKFIATAGITNDDNDMQTIVVSTVCNKIYDATCYGNVASYNEAIEAIDAFSKTIFAIEVLKILRIIMPVDDSGINMISEFAQERIYIFFALSKYKNPDNDSLNEMLREVCISNMSKFDRCTFDAIHTQRKYRCSGIKTSYKRVNGLYVTRSAEKNNDDYPFGKVLKSVVNYKEPCFIEIIKKLTVEA